ncbi:hypothetical protein DPMN_024222 [Dreissena polymorpha]|uniref:Uncharacterized protein n=1 Tax=Dreissena polymorpha TaxID=45954 RepID=A0A9D4LR04_DREPO|nr:hypothetical protein DPMN_024222 [Dreissena polymorpha]
MKGNRYATNHVMVEMGSDFQYRDADKWYRNLDMLIEKVNARVKHTYGYCAYFNM